MTVTLSKAAVLLESASKAVGEAQLRFRRRAASGHRLLATLDERELAALLEASSWLNAGAGDYIAHQGSPVESVLFIMEGQAREEVSDAETGAYRAVLNFLHSGEEVGLLSLVDRSAHQASVIAMGRLRALQVPLGELARHIQAHPEWHRVIAEIAVSRCRASGLWLQALL